MRQIQIAQPTMYLGLFQRLQAIPGVHIWWCYERVLWAATIFMAREPCEPRGEDGEHN
jgi:hypothetical protein